MMILTRTLIAALCCAYAAALSPLGPAHGAGDNSDCALYLNGPGRTSAYDYSINLLKGNFGYEGQANCITYEAINQAYLEARNRILVSQPKGDWKAEHFASVGELILDISINLARRYGLTYEEIEKGLPLIDTSRTLIREVCPPVFSHVECRAGKYRRFDGLCNNLQNPTWGATMAPFQRLIGPLFADGINSPRIAHHGKDLPLSRVVSRTMHPDEGFHDHAGTVMVIAWGQFMDHDYTLTGTPLDPVNRNDPEECCKRPLHLKHPYCNEIRIPDDDYFYRLFGVKCIDFVRGFPSPRPGCRLGSRVPFNTLTGTIDGNTVYGVTEKFARKLRTGFGGLLRMNPVFKEYGLKDLLPLKLDVPDEGCTRPNKNMYCFEAGEIRVNEQLVLTVMHTLMAREHNRVAYGLAEVNPHWDDETLFQEARRINIAEIQHITYNEFLPILLGKDVMEKFGLVLEKEGYWDGYDPEVNPDVIASFASAAYRFGHSLLPTAVERWSKAHKFIASKRLSDLIRRPYDLYRAGVLDEYVMGLMNQVAQAMDDSITQEVTNHLFKKVGARFGMDLVSFNMQRGREFGIPGYMEFRKFCGLPSAETFQDLFGSMPNATVEKYETIFDHPIDVDLWSGGVSERPLPGSMLGPTFACIIATQFSYSRRGDRFWFELPNQPSSFTPEQMTEIRKSRLARVICDNTDIIDTVQLYPMVLPDHELNPRVPCRSGVIPSMDFSKWAETAPFRGAAKQFMTNATTVENNSTSHDQISKGPCIQTANSVNGTQNCVVNTLQTQNNHCSNNTNNNANTTDCETITATENNSTNNTKDNQVVDKNTVLKYVYKKGDKAEIPIKDKGHFKNSLRRKRSTNGIHHKSPLPSKFQKPVIVNYETVHGSGEVLAPLRNNGHNVLGANLADFNIETVHLNPGAKKDEHVAPNLKRDSSEIENLNEANNEKGDKQNDSNGKSSSESEESAERRDYKNGKSQHENENSDERGDYRNRKPSREDQDRAERGDYKSSKSANDDSGEREDYQNKKPNRKNDGSLEHADYKNRQSNLKEDNSAERGAYKNSDSSLERGESEESGSYKNSESSREHDDSSDRGNYKSAESNENNPRTSSRDYKSAESNENNPRTSSKDYKSAESNENNPRSSSRDYKSAESNENNPRSSSRDYKSNESNENNPRTSSRDYKSAESNENNPGTNSRDYKSAESNENNPRSSSRDYKSAKSNENNPRSSSRDYKSNESNENNPRTSSRDYKSAESNENNPRTNSKDYKSAESNENNPRTSSRYLQNKNSKQSTESNESRKPGPNSSESKESIETEDRKNLDSSNESSDESSESIERTKPQRKYKTNPKTDINSPVPLRDIDLDDFNSERVHVNNDGKIEPQKDNLEYTDPKTAVEILPLSTAVPDPEIKNHGTLNSLPDVNTLASPEVKSNGNKLIHIDDGEVRPVVEINPESDNDEENTKSNVSDEDESLESILGVKEPENFDDSSPKDKIVEQKEVQNRDVKEEFERIPVNYDHAKNTENKDSPSTAAPNVDTEVTPKDGTLDIFAPEDVKYDENLKIKFDDIAIQLPDIQLPDDIIAYTRDSSPYNYDDDKKETQPDVPSYRPSYYYDHDDKEKLRKSKNKKDDDDSKDDDYRAPDTGYYGYYDDSDKKQNYKNKNAKAESDDAEAENDEEEDLYEKFVRERFGKQGTFEKRSEKLQAGPATNPELYKTIKNILKKTADIDEQAKKSGDPNAGYMWTLEYGEKL